MKRYTWRDWLAAHRGMRLFWIDASYRELGWRYFRWRPWRMFRAKGLIPEAWYYARCRAWTRYHVVAPRTLPPTWQDADERMLHAMFEILRSVIEDERIFDHTEAVGDPSDGESWAWAIGEMRALWHWWTVDRPAREAEYERRLREWGRLRERDIKADRSRRPDAWAERPAVVDESGRRSWPSSMPSDDAWQSAEQRAAWESLGELDDNVRDDEDDAMLVRLVRVRRYLWT